MSSVTFQLISGQAKINQILCFDWPPEKWTLLPTQDCPPCPAREMVFLATKSNPFSIKMAETMLPCSFCFLVHKHQKHIWPISSHLQLVKQVWLITHIILNHFIKCIFCYTRSPTNNSTFRVFPGVGYSTRQCSNRCAV